jgi:hypothetical protein
MMKNGMRRLVVLAIVGSIAPLAQAGWPELHAEFHRDRIRNNAWPQPFRGMDATAVANPFELQKNNGWREFNTIGSNFFDKECALTDAGMHKVSVAIMKTPSNRKALFVLKGESPDQTSQRVEAVQIAVSKMIPVGPLPEIFVTDQDNVTVSGETQTLLNRGIKNSMPAPVLPTFTGLNTPSGQAQTINSSN